MEERGGASYRLQLAWRRRTANLAEMIFNATHLLLVPLQYGYLGSFGVTQRHPSVIISETCRPLDLFLPGDGNGVQTADMGIDPDGYLWVFDRRLSPAKRPDDLLPYAPATGTDEEGVVWLGNIGVTTSGHYVFLDRSDHGNVEALIHQWNFCPRSWGLTLTGTPAQTKEFSKTLYSVYQRQLWRCTRGEEETWKKETEIYPAALSVSQAQATH